MASNGKSSAEYEAELARLREENERLKRQSSMTLLGGVAVAPRGGASTIAGIEELVLQLGVDNAVGYVNAPMARVLGMADRKAALGTPLESWDHGALGDGSLASLAELARGSDEPRVVERAFGALSPERLPGPVEGRPAGDPILSFVVSSKDGRVQLIAQDVTKLRWLEATFARYVSPKVIQQMRAMSMDEFLVMERREITVLFTDMRGFTSLVQSERPAAVQETVNSFLSTMVDCVERFDGTVQGFAGDEVMALFGAPVPYSDHALRGLLCAIEMQAAHRRWMAERESADQPTRQAGIGLATGAVVVGNIGTPSRMCYTAQGHATNLAARLCSAASGGEVLTVPETHAAAIAAVKSYASDTPLPRLSFEPRGTMSFKNVAQPVQVIAVKTKS